MTDVATAPTGTVNLSSSPIHNLRPISPDPIQLPLDKIVEDPTNPGMVTTSMRDKRRVPSFNDSWEILSTVVYPVVVCQIADDPDRHMLVDGHGRYTLAKAKGAQFLRAIVYGPLTLEERICLRQVLNAAQEPFDVASIIHDLRELANARNIDVRDPNQIRMLVRDLPEKVRKREQDLVILARWDPAVVKKVGESYGRRGPESAMGMDKVKELTKAMDVMAERHPVITAAIGGDMALSTKLAEMYGAGRFAQGRRSQEGIRAFVDVLKDLPANHDRVTDLFTGTEDLPSGADATTNGIELCQSLASWLITKDSASLTDSERRVLKGTLRSIQEVLS